MIFDPMVPVAGAIILFLGVVTFIVMTGRSGQRRGRVVRVARRILIALALLIIGLRPGIPDLTEQTVVATDIDVFIALDTTGSVSAEDYNGDSPRLDGMRNDVKEIVNALPGARISLITFDAVAVIRVPLTRDGTAVLSALEVLRPEVTGYSAGSTISEPRDLLLETLANARESNPTHKRVVIYLGDGEQTSGGEPESFAEIAELVDGGAVLGYGTEQGGPMLENLGFFWEDNDYYDEEYYEDDGEADPVPTYIQDYSKYPAEDAISVMDDDNLAAIADQVGVPYEHRSEPGAIDALDGVDELGETKLEKSGSAGMQELYWMLALLAFALLLWEAGVVAVGIADAFAAPRRRT